MQYALSDLAAGDLGAASRRMQAARKLVNALSTVDPVSRGQMLLASARVAMAEGDTETGCSEVRQAVTLAQRTFGDDNVRTARARAMAEGCATPERRP